jgi:hypothetical protein
MQQENFSPQDSLRLIDSMINQAKNRFNENGFLYLLWGWLILACAIGHFVLIKLNWFKHPEIIWASWIIAMIYQIIFLVRKKKTEKVKTYSDTIISSIWICFGMCMMVLTIIISRNNGWMYMNPIILLMYGIPTFLSGVVMQFTPLKIGGIACWMLAILSTFFLPIYYLLFLAAAVIVAWIIPGYLLRKKYNAQNN